MGVRSICASARSSIALLVLWVAAIGATPQAGQQARSAQAPTGAKPLATFRSQTNLVLVDVRVRDKAGGPISDLKPEDFRVYEDGVPQQIVSFSLEDVERFAAQAAEHGAPPTIDLGALPSEAARVDALRDRRLLVLFFDLTSMPVGDLMRSLTAARDFVGSHLTPADLVAVVTSASVLRVAQDFTNDRAALTRALDAIRVGESSSLAVLGATGNAGSTGANGEDVVAEDTSAAFTPDETEFNIFNTDEKLAAVESLARMLRDIPGRKSVIHFSSGLTRTGIENQVQLRAATDAANQADVSFYTLDARGLVAQPPGGDAFTSSPQGTAAYTGQAFRAQVTGLQDSRETLATLASDTGGKTFTDLNDFSQVFQEVQEDNSTYYLLGYASTNSRADGRFRRIRVEVTRRGVDVEARPGYFAPKNFRQFTREDKERQLQQALTLDAPFTDLPMAVQAAYFRQADNRYYVVLAAKIPGSALSFAGGSAERQTELDFVWRASDPAGRAVAALRDTLPLKLDQTGYQQVAGGNVLYEGGLELPPGRYTLKVAARENRDGRIGTFEAPIELPPTDAAPLAVSSVVLSNQLQPVAAASRRQQGTEGSHPLARGAEAIVPSVTSVFRGGQSLYVYFESYGGSTSPRPPASVVAMFFLSGVKVSEAGPFSGVRDAGSGKTSYFLQIPLDNFRSGRYTLQLNVVDAAADRVAFARLPLVILPPLPVASAR
jgi:VWFA-related protein